MLSSRHALAIVLASSVLAASSRPPAAVAGSPLGTLAGKWRGSANVGVDWTAQRTLAIELTIDSAQHVRGRIGDAELTLGVIRENAGLVKRKIGRQPQLIVEGWLKGPVIASEEVRRGGVTIPLDVRDGQLVGAVQTTGSNAGDTEQKILTAGPLVLRRE